MSKEQNQYKDYGPLFYPINCIVPENIRTLPLEGFIRDWFGYFMEPHIVRFA